MTKIVSVEFCLARVPLNTATGFATRTVALREYALVKVRGDDGVEGIGFCYAGHKGGEIVLAAVHSLFAPLLLGADTHAVTGLWKAMYDEALLHGRTGSVMRALSILDVALWDRNARAAGLPLSSYLGAQCGRTVPAYASGGYYLDGKTPADVGREMAGYVGLGFKAVKMKVGGADAATDAHRVREARAAIGPEVLLMLDANNAWRDLPTALEYLRGFEPANPYWIEEPFSPDDIDNHARLAKATPVSVATGEIEAGRWRHLELLQRGGAAILQTDAAVCGGVTEFRRIADIAAGFGVAMCPHWFHDLHVHLVASIENGQFVEFFPDAEVLNFRLLIDNQLSYRDGNLILPSAPGLGFNFDGKAIQRFAGGWTGLGEAGEDAA
jgi:L-alanine-DL-glutamate epimerase-like enolase superfamily enzyme